MVKDPAPELRTELLAALAVVQPQIRGLEKIVNDLPIDPALTAVQEQIVGRKRRRDLIKAVLQKLDELLAALQALYDDGYPKLDQTEVPDEILAELVAEEEDIAAGVGVFKKQSIATTLEVPIGTPIPKETLHG